MRLKLSAEVYMEMTTDSTDHPDLLDRYRIQMRLGRGGSGDVYLAYDRQRSEKVAVKILKDIQTPKNVNLKERFIQEAERTKELTHPNIVKVHEIHEISRYEYREEIYKDTLCYSMEYVEGKSLTNVVKQAYRRFKDINHICEQILEALSYLHAHGIVHRDLKPENVYLTDQRRVKLIDLGMMKAEDSMIRTAGDVLLGTVQYMAPEYMRHKIVDTRGDLYALGIVLLEIMLGKHLYEGMRTDDITKHLFRVNFQIEPRLLNYLHPKYKYIVLKATATNLEDRFQTAMEMCEEFNKNDDEYFNEKLKTITTDNNLSDRNEKRHTKTGSAHKQKTKLYILILTIIFAGVLAVLAMQ